MTLINLFQEVARSSVTPAKMTFGQLGGTFLNTGTWGAKGKWQMLRFVDFSSANSNVNIIPRTWLEKEYRIISAEWLGRFCVGLMTLLTNPNTPLTYELRVRVKK